MSREGVIKFESDHTQAALDAAAREAAESLIGWRNVLFRAGLIGRDPARYDGVGYGNVSIRIDAESFVVSGTQTSPIADVTAEHFVRIDQWDIGRNRVVSRGALRPSSESMTHATLYEVSRQIECVLHVHSPDIWGAWERLGLATTPPGVDYGTPEMATAVRAIFEGDQVANSSFVMLGHEDGVVVWGASVREAGVRLMDLFARSLAPEA